MHSQNELMEWSIRMRRPDRVAGPCCNMAECTGRVYRPPMPTANRFAGVTWHATTLDHAPGTPADLPAYLDHVLAHTRSEGGRSGDGINLAFFRDRRRPDSSFRLAGRSAAGG
jgi:hypothetical protein